MLTEQRLDDPFVDESFVFEVVGEFGALLTTRLLDRPVHRLADLFA